MNVFDLFPKDNQIADEIVKSVRAVKEDAWHAGDNAWSSENNQWTGGGAGSIVSEDELQLGDEVLVTYPNQFQGKRGEITGFGRDKAFVIVEIDGREYSMHSSDVERLGGSEDWDNDDDYGTFGDDERDELDEYKGAHDKITFEVDSENAYNHIMHKYGNVIDWAGDYMTVPARYWPAVQELAFAAGGDVQEISTDGFELDEVSKAALGRYVKAAGKDVEQRASSQSFVSGKRGDPYNKADPTHADTRREKGIDLALRKLTREQKVAEGASVQDIFNAITYRLEHRNPEVFSDYGVEVVAEVIRDVAYFHEGAEELGSSDIGSMAREVLKDLQRREAAKGVAEGLPGSLSKSDYMPGAVRHDLSNIKSKKTEPYRDPHRPTADIDPDWGKEQKAKRGQKGVAEGEYDPSYDPDYRPYQKPEQDPDAWKQDRDLEEPSAPTTVTIKDLDGNVVLTFPSTGGFYGDKKYAMSKGFDTEAGDYDIKWQRQTTESGQGDDSTSPVGGNVQEGYWARLKHERYLKEHKKAFSLLDELKEVFKDK